MEQSIPPFPLTIRLFGPSIDVLVHGEPLRPLRSRKGEWLLALLAIHHRRSLPREWLIECLWPDSDAVSGARSLRQSLWDLRQALKAQAGRVVSPNDRSLCLDLGGAWCDLLEFDAAIARGDLDSLRSAVEIYRGDLLQPCEESWALAEREARTQAALRALETLAAAAEAEGNAEESLSYRRKAATLAPLAEPLLARLMQAAQTADRHAEAVEAYHAYRRRLAELGPSYHPSADVVRAYEQSQAELRKASASKLKSPRPGQPIHFRLPAPVIGLVGRAEAVSEICALMASRRLVTLTGPGGIGKTSLAIACGLELAPSYSNGAALIDLSTIHDPNLIAATAAAALRLPTDANAPAMEAILDALREARLLVVLDNCEHLIDGASAFAATVLSGCEGVGILATSREALSVGGESVVTVSPLSLPRADTVAVAVAFASAQASTAVQLFVERAHAADASFCLTAASAPAVAEICRKLDGIPLGLELAAALVLSTTPETLAAGLDSRLQLLTQGPRTAHVRHRTLAAAIDWSYERLSEPEQALFRRLSVFSGGWTAAAAEDVCAGASFAPRVGARGANCAIPDFANQTVLAGAVADLLRRLVQRSMIVYDRTADRYRFLETLREYAAEKLAAEREESEIVAARHGYYYHELSCNWGELDRSLLYEVEKDNDRAALKWCVTTPCAISWGLTFIAALAPLWLGSGDLIEGLTWAERILSHPDATDYDEYALAAHCGGYLALQRGDFVRAHGWLQASLDACLGIIGRGAMAEGARVQMSTIEELPSVTLRYLGDIALINGDIERSTDYYQSSVQHGRAFGCKSTYSAHLAATTEAALLRVRGDFAGARRLTEMLLSESIEHDWWTEIYAAETFLAEVSYEQGDGYAARLHACNVLRIAINDDFGSIIERPLLVLARIASDAGEHAFAALLTAGIAHLCEKKTMRLPAREETALRRMLADTSEHSGCDGIDEYIARGRTMPWRELVAYAIDESALLLPDDYQPAHYEPWKQELSLR